MAVSPSVPPGRGSPSQPLPSVDGEASTALGRTSSGTAFGFPALAAYLALWRPRQWYKNLLVFVPLVFSGNAFVATLWPPALFVFLGFVLLAGATYAVNDVVDAARDRAHPRKCRRPVAAGLVPPWGAVGFAAASGFGGMAILWHVNAPTFVMGGLYLLLQTAYNGGLKHVVLWDALAVSGGLVLRAIAGTTAIAVGDPTQWLIVCTFLFAFYLALAKRRHELVLAGENVLALGHRPTLSQYTVPFLDQAMQVAMGLVLVTYSLYTFFGTTAWMMVTLPFAFYGILRHAYLVHRRDLEDEAEMILTDRPTLVNAACWVAIVILVLQGIPQALYALLEAF